jgi:hypothetical protein
MRRDTPAPIVLRGHEHTSMSEWIVAGVTHDLLRSNPVCCMLPH